MRRMSPKPPASPRRSSRPRARATRTTTATSSLVPWPRLGTPPLAPAEAAEAAEAAPPPAPLRVLYLHGLDSDPAACAKIAALRAAFGSDGVLAPFLGVGRYSLLRPNSVLRCVLRCAASGGPASLARRGLACALRPAERRKLLAAAVEQAAARSLALAAAAALPHQQPPGPPPPPPAGAAAFPAGPGPTAAAPPTPPLLLVGRSWGGGLALALVAAGLWRGPVLLLSPAGGAMARSMPPGR